MKKSTFINSLLALAIIIGGVVLATSQTQALEIEIGDTKDVFISTRLRVDNLDCDEGEVIIVGNGGFLECGSAGGTGGTGIANYTARWTGASTLGTGVLYDNGTRVGIGTTNPQQQLQLTGSLRLPVTTSTTTGVIYKDGIPFIHDFKPAGRDGYNVFIGMNSGNFTMRGSSSAHGSYNIAVGANTLTSITEGRFNTAMGYLALTKLTTGYLNTAIGSEALASTTSGFKNLAFGNVALRSNETGYQNVAIGGSSLGNNIDGNDNSALGHGALVSHKTGNSNTGVGVYSLYYQTSGTGNVGIGLHAGSRLADNKATRTTGNYGVYIGANSKASADGTNNEIVIGYNAIGKGSSTVVLGNDNITNTYLKGQVHVDTPLTSSSAVTKSYVDGIANALAPTTPASPWYVGGNNITGGGKGMFGSSNNYDIGIKTNNIERMTILASNGNVGIGTSNPGINKLNVVGGPVLLGGSVFSGPTSTSILRIASQGTPGTVRPYIELMGVTAADTTNENGGATIKFRTSTSVGYGPEIGGIRRSGGAGDMIFRTGGSNVQERMRILDNGNVGIGTTNPLDKLHVVGTIRTNLTCTASGSALKTDSTGRIYCGAVDEVDAAIFLRSRDTRSVNDSPNAYPAVVKFDFKSNGTNGLYDGGSYNGVMTWKSYGNTTDFSGGPVMQLSYTSNGNLWTRLSTGATTWGTWRKVLVENNSGRVGIGTTNPGAKLEINNTSGPADITLIHQTSGNYRRWRIESGNTYAVDAFSIKDTSGGTFPSIPEFMITRSDGNGTGRVGIGTNSPQYKLDINGQARSLGFVYNSDIRLKKDVRTISGALDKVLALRGVNFTWKENGKPSVGLIAQEVEKIFPELVSGDDEKGVQYGNLVAPLIEAVKEQQKIINNLEARLSILEIKNKSK
ncbi:MAG: tail fiber domain-containing protein [Patescibacteria group bacterium]